MAGYRAHLSRKGALAGVAAAALLAVAATGCGSASGSGSTGGAAEAAAVVKSGAAALKNAHSVGFDVKASVNVDGSLKGVNQSQGALLSGPVTLELKGHAQKSGKSGAFDTTFDLGASGFTISGEVLSANGKTAYVRLPMLLGPGWKSVNLQPQGISMKQASPKNQMQLHKLFKAGGINPIDLLKNITVTSGGGTDTVSADLNVVALVKDVDALARGQLKPVQLRQFTGIIKVAHGSVSYDSSTHLPSAAHLEVAVHVPAKLAKSAQGVSGADVKIDATFDDWNQPVQVTAPAHSKPLNLARVKGFKLA